MDPAELLLLVIAVAVPTAALFGHFYAAYRVAPRRAVEGIQAWYASTEGMQFLADTIEGWVKSERGAASLGRIIDTAATVTKDAVVSTLTGAAGGARKAADAKIAGLLSGAVSFGNPILDGLWAWAPVDAKKLLIKTLLQILRGATGQELQELMGAEAGAPAVGTGWSR